MEQTNGKTVILQGFLFKGCQFTAALGFSLAESRPGGADVEVIVLDLHRMHCTARRTFFIFSVFKTHLTNMLAAASNFDADNGSIVKDIHPVVAVVTFFLAVHDYITPLLIIVK